MKKRLISLLLVIAMVLASPLSYIKAYAEEWQEYEISVSDAEGIQTVAMPVDNAKTHAYWVKLAENDKMEGLVLHINHMTNQGYIFYPANGTTLSGLVDANGTLEGEYLAVQVFNEKGDQIDTLLLYFSKSSAPTLEAEAVSATVNVFYRDTKGTTVAQDTFEATALGTNSVMANSSLIPEGYHLADTDIKNVELMANGVVEPNQIVFLVDTEAVDLGSEILVEYVDETGQPIVSEKITVSTTGENTINANIALIPQGFVIDGAMSQSVYLGENNTPEPSVVRFNIKQEVLQEISAKISVLYVDTNGEYLNSEQVNIDKQGTNTINANQSMVPEGYTIYGSESYDVELNSDGTVSTDSVSFTYLAPEKSEDNIYSITITVKYLDKDNPEIELKPASSEILETVGEHTIKTEYPTIDGYQLVSPESVVVKVNQDNTVDLPEVSFMYKKVDVTIAEVEFNPININVYYIDQDNNQIEKSTQQTIDNPGDYEIKPYYSSIDGYTLVGQGTQSLTVYDDGSASSAEVYFTYKKSETNNNAELNISSENEITKLAESSGDETTKLAEVSENEVVENNEENPPTQDYEGKTGTINNNSVNVRKKPSKNADQITKLKKGTEVTILEVVENKNGDKWAKVEYNNKRTGYVLMSFIDVSENASETEPKDPNATEAAEVNAVLKVQYIAEDGIELYQYESTYDKSGEYTVELRNVQETVGFEVVGENSQTINIDTNGNIDKNPLVFKFKKMSINAEVTIHYVDSENSAIADDDTKVYTSAGDYTLAPEKEIGGFKLLEPTTYAVYVNESGIATPNDIIFKYDKKSVTGAVDIEYVDDKGNMIADTTTHELDEVGTVTITPETILTDYELTGESSYQVTLNSDGTVVPQKVQFVYTKKEIAINAKLTIHYTDENAKPIADDSTQSFTSAGTHDVYPNASIPADYEIQGDIKKTVILDQNNVLTPSEITFVYKKIEKPIVIDAKLKVRYVDTESNPIAQDDIVVLTEVGQQTISPKLKLSDYILQNETENVTVNPDNTVVPNEITFIYERILPKDPSADITIMYVNENGTPIAQNTIQTINRVGNNTVVANPESIPADYELIGNKQMNVVLYENGTAEPNPAIFVYKNTKDDYEHYKGYALSNSRVALRSAPSGNDKVIIKNLDRNTLLYIAGQQKNNGILYHSVQLLNGENGFIMDSDITKITDAEAEKYKQAYLDSIKPKDTPKVVANVGYAMTLGNIPFRQFASGYSNIIQELYSGTVVFLNGKVEYNEDKAWFVAQYNNKLGYVRSDQVRMLSPTETSNYLKNNNAVQPIESKAPEYNPNGLSSYGYVTSGDVNFRTEPNKRARIIEKIKRYGMGLILETTNVDGTIWYKINYDGKTGYVQGDYFKNMTLDEFRKFLQSKEYRQGIENNSNIENNTGNTVPIRKPKYDKGSATPGKVQTIEDYNANTWRNPNIAKASYEPFRPNLTPMPEVDQVVISPTPTMIVDPSFNLEVLGTSPSTSLEPSESISPIVTDPVKENTEGASPLVFIGLLGVFALGGVGVYAAIMKKKRQRLLEAQKAKHMAAQRQNAQQRPNMPQSATPQDPYANPTSYGRNNYQNQNKNGANQFRPGTDAFKKPSDSAEQSVLENSQQDKTPGAESNRRRRR